MSRLALIVLVFATMAPMAQAAGGGPDLVLDVKADQPAPHAEPYLRVAEWTAGERVVWNLTIDADFFVIELRAKGFDIDRPRQLVPTLAVGPAYPLFEPVAYADLWNADGAARITHAFQSNDETIIRLGIPGPANGTLILTRDTTPPGIDPGPRTSPSHFGFYQETRTDELALVKLQVRPKGTEAWNENPTTVYHFLQRFPVQGLDPDTEYETSFIVTDWAQNEVTVDGGPFRTLDAPERLALAVLPVSPRPDAAVRDPWAPIVAEFPEGTVLQDNGVRFFLDKAEVRENLVVEGNLVSYQPPQPLSVGRHSVSVEITSQEGGHGVARWAFQVEPHQAPASGAAQLLVALVFVALVVRARRTALK